MKTNELWIITREIIILLYLYIFLPDRL